MLHYNKCREIIQNALIVLLSLSLPHFLFWWIPKKQKTFQCEPAINFIITEFRQHLFVCKHFNSKSYKNHYSWLHFGVQSSKFKVTQRSKSMISLVITPDRIDRVPTGVIYRWLIYGLSRSKVKVIQSSNTFCYLSTDGNDIKWHNVNDVVLWLIPGSIT